MRTRTKKMLSLLLATAMVFTMNAFAFADEIVEDQAVVAAEEGTTVSGADASSSNYSVSADESLSKNAASISENLKEVVSEKVGDGKFFIVYPRAYAFDGKNKPGSKNAKLDSVIKVYKPKSGATVSAADLISDNKINAVSFDECPIKKITLKAAKGATVALDGTPLYEVKKSTYIKGIKLEDKQDNKDFKAAFKDTAKNLKKSTDKVSANGVKVGGTDTTAFVIGVYPCYGGNDKEGMELAKKIGLQQATEISGKTKEKNGAVKKIQMTAGGKKVTLKPTKKPGKFKGIADSGKETDATDAMKAAGHTGKYVVLDGNFAGNFFLGTSTAAK